MKCPYCGSNESQVVDKRDNSDEGITRRRRECSKCFKRFTTYERVENLELDVQKKNGTTEKFNREKLIRSVKKSVSKRPVTDEQIVRMVEDIEMKLLNRKTKIIKSVDIGNMVLNRLKWLDGVAYMRFASVYKEFESLNDFQQEIKLLKKNHEQSTK